MLGSGERLGAAFAWPITRPSDLVHQRDLFGTHHRHSIVRGFPSGAAATAEYCRRIGMRSILVIPISVGGRIMASIGFGSVRSAREWPEAYIARLKVIGEVMVQALLRNRSEAALRASEAETARLMRQTLLGELSGTIAHELNQPLTAILANAETAMDLLSQKNIDLSKIKEIVADIIEQDCRASEVVGRVRKLLRKGENRPEVIDANQLVELTMHLLRGEFIRQKVHIDFMPANNLPMISGDPVQLQQVLLNLIMNAMEAMSTKEPSQRAINITTRANDKKIEVAIVDFGTGLRDRRRRAGLRTVLYDEAARSWPRSIDLLIDCQGRMEEHSVLKTTPAMARRRSLLCRPWSRIASGLRHWAISLELILATEE